MKFNNIAKRIAAAGLAAGLVLSTSVVSMAETEPYAYTKVNGSATACTFNKYLIMDAGDTVPNVTFNFTVSPGQAVSADTSNNAKFQVIPGTVMPTIGTAAFVNTDSTKLKTEVTDNEIDVKRTIAQRAEGATSGVQLDDGQKYATKPVTVDFSQVTFDEPGIYRYIIAETASADHAAAGIMHDNDTDRVLDVYVIDNNGSLEVAQYVLHTSVSEPAINTTMGSADPTPLADKTDGFTNEYSSKDLAVKKEVAGNQASRDKYFDITIKVSGLGSTDNYAVSIGDDNIDGNVDGNADRRSGSNAATIAANAGKENKTSLTGAELAAGAHYYLQHGQSVVVRGLPINATYEVSENAEDYKSEAKGVTGYTDAEKTTGNQTIGDIAGTKKTVQTSFKNTRDGVVPTGVILDSAPFIIIIGLAVAALAFTALRKKSR